MATILIVDDEPVVRDFLAKLLKGNGHRALETSSAAEALEQVRIARPDIVITDILMPMVDGFEFVRQLRGDPAIAHTPVIFMTAAFQEQEARPLAEACGAHHVIMKPSSNDEILRTVDQALHAPRAAGSPVWSDRFDAQHLGLLTHKLAEKVQELKAAHRRLADSEALCHSIIQTAGNVILYLSADCCILEWNQEAERLYGLQRQEVLGKNYIDLCLPEQLRAAVAANLRKVLAGDSSRGLEYPVGAADGREHLLSWNIDRLLNQSGEPVGLVAVGQDVSQRQQAEDQLRKYSERLQVLSRRLLAVQEEERRHLSRELHDEFGQILATITLHLHAAKGLAGEAALPRLDECATLLQQAGEQVRSLALELRPTMLDTLGLEPTLRWLAEHHQQRTSCEMQIAGHLSGAPLSPELAIACFRVAQEALTNVLRHAAARHVWIELSQSESVLELVVRDDGVGFDVVATQEQAARGGRLGLLGMAERVQLLGGALQLESDPGRGARIRASFPLSKVSEEPAEPE